MSSKSPTRLCLKGLRKEFSDKLSCRLKKQLELGHLSAIEKVLNLLAAGILPQDVPPARVSRRRGAAEAAQDLRQQLISPEDGSAVLRSAAFGDAA
jgi:hypothetical protein